MIPLYAYVYMIGVVSLDFFPYVYNITNITT